MRPEYDFTKGVRGKYVEAYRSGTNLVLLDADVAAVFPDAASVNRALRVLHRGGQAGAACPCDGRYALRSPANGQDAGDASRQATAALSSGLTTAPEQRASPRQVYAAPGRIVRGRRWRDGVGLRACGAR